MEELKKRVKELEANEEKWKLNYKKFNHPNKYGFSFYQLHGKTFCGKHNKKLKMMKSYSDYDYSYNYDRFYYCDQCSMRSDDCT
jgi:hypothetical protein